MDLQLKNKTVFISGSTAGIGFGIARIFLAEGADVVINGRSEASVQHAIQGLKKEYPDKNIHGIPCDFSKFSEIEQLISRLPQIDILINNVGIYTSQTFFDTSDEDWQKQLEVNIMSGVRLSKHLLPKMMEKGWGRIIFISSECATLVPGDLIAYSSTKTAILGISRGLAQLTRGSNVTVNTVVPGSTMTEGAEQFLSNLAKEKNTSIEVVENEFFRDVRTSSLLERFIDVKEVANTVVYFSSPLASATNGAVIKVDGGSMGGIL